MHRQPAPRERAVIPGSDPRAERRRLVIYLVLITAAAAVFVIIGVLTAKPALVGAALTALVFALGRTLLDVHRDRMRRRDDR